MALDQNVCTEKNELIFQSCNDVRELVDLRKTHLRKRCTERVSTCWLSLALGGCSHCQGAEENLDGPVFALKRMFKPSNLRLSSEPSSFRNSCTIIYEAQAGAP